MKSETFGYTKEDVNKIIAVIIEMMNSAILLEKPVKWTDTPKAHHANKYTGKDMVYEAAMDDDYGKKITVYLYYAPISPFEFNLDCNRRVGFNTVEGMLRIYWRLTGKKFPGTEEYKGIYWLKNPLAPDNQEVQLRDELNIGCYATWFNWYIKNGTGVGQSLIKV